MDNKLMEIDIYIIEYCKECIKKMIDIYIIEYCKDCIKLRLTLNIFIYYLFKIN